MIFCALCAENILLIVVLLFLTILVVSLRHFQTPNYLISLVEETIYILV